MYKIFGLIVCVLLINGCSGKELRKTGEQMTGSSAPMAIIGLPMYGIGKVMEDKEDKTKIEEDKIKAKADIEKPLIEDKIVETEK